MIIDSISTNRNTLGSNGVNAFIKYQKRSYKKYTKTYASIHDCIELKTSSRGFSIVFYRN